MDKKLNQNVQLVLAAFSFLAIYIYAALQQWQYQNTSIHLTDQGAYVDLLLRLIETNFRHADGNRMPFYLMVQSIFYSDTLTKHELWTRGIIINIGLSVIFLFCFYLFYKKVFPPSIAAYLVLICAFTISVMKAPYYQAELLYYFLFFITFVLMCAMFIRPSWKLAIGIGLFAGLAQLTKASALAAFAIFVIIFGLKIAFQMVQKRSWMIKSLGQFTLIILVFLVIYGPYAKILNDKFGSYFYNVNTTFYFWYDSWDEAVQGTRAAGDRDGWPDLPPEEIPSFKNYLRTHTFAEIVSRLETGVKVMVVKHCAGSYGHCKYVIIFSWFSLYSVYKNREEIFRYIKKYPYLTLFICGLFSAYFVLIAWYTAIVLFERVALPLFYPFLLVTAYLVYKEPFSHTKITLAKRQFNMLDVLKRFLLFSVLLDIALLLVLRAQYVYGGG